MINFKENNKDILHKEYREYERNFEKIKNCLFKRDIVKIRKTFT